MRRSCESALAVKRPEPLLRGLLVALLLGLQPLQAAPLDDLLDSIHLRLELAREVAWFKHLHHLPVEDRDREEALLAGLPKVEGLSPQQVRDFMQCQLEASKELQEHLLEAWQEKVPPGAHARELYVLRQQLDQLTPRLLRDFSHSQFTLHRPDAAEILEGKVRRVFGTELEPGVDRALRPLREP